MTRIFLTISVCIIIISCNNHQENAPKKTQENRYSIIGKIGGKDTGWVFLAMDDTTKKRPLIIFDSARISGSGFMLHGKLPNSLICKITVKNIRGWPYTHFFVLDTGITKVQLYNDSMGNSIITGTVMQNQLNIFNKKLFDLDTSFSKYYSLNNKGIISDDSLSKLEKKFYSDKYDLILQQIKSNPKAVTSAFIARSSLTDEIDLSTFEQVCKSLGKANNYYARHLAQVLLIKNQTATDKKAPYFNISDNKNRTFTNDSFKGKYLLLDFWASWCVPCRAESPYLVKAYQKYAGKGLEIISISSDGDKKKWKNAIKNDKLTWIQAFKLKGANSKVNRDFGVFVIPSNFLIDKEGRIVGKNLRGEDIENELKEKLGNN